MKNRWLYVATLGHFGLSLMGWTGLYGWALASQDTVGASPDLTWIEWPLQFILLQPLAHWVLTLTPFVWWTWPGLATLAVLLAANSLTALAVTVALIRGLRAWSVVR